MVNLKKNVKRFDALNRHQATRTFRILARDIKRELNGFTRTGGFKHFELILEPEKNYDPKSAKMVETGYALFTLQLGAQSSITRKWKIPVHFIEKYDKDCCKAIESLGFCESEVSPHGDYSVLFILDL